MATPVTQSRADVLRTLEELKPELLSRYKVKEIGLFGSFVRGEEGEDSDVDILVDVADGATLFDLARLALFLEDHLQRKVDLVPKDDVRAELRETILREVVH